MYANETELYQRPLMELRKGSMVYVWEAEWPTSVVAVVVVVVVATNRLG